MKDLWGNDVTYPDPVVVSDKRKPTRPKGYASNPGTGPSGETCKTCAFYARVGRAKVYRKCLKVRHRWTNGPGTDILAKSPACFYWEKQTTT